MSEMRRRNLESKKLRINHINDFNDIGKLRIDGWLQFEGIIESCKKKEFKRIIENLNSGKYNNNNKLTRTS